MISQESDERNDLFVSALVGISSLTDILIEEINKREIQILPSSSRECERILEEYGGKMPPIGSGWYCGFSGTLTGIS